VQGHLRKQPLSVSFRSTCACCDESIRIDIDDELSYGVFGEASPVIFMPLVNFKKVKDPSIVDVF